MSKNKGGRKPKVTDAIRARIIKAMTTTSKTVKQISDEFKIPVSTIYYQIGSRKDLLAAI